MDYRWEKIEVFAVKRNDENKDLKKTDDRVKDANRTSCIGFYVILRYARHKADSKCTVENQEKRMKKRYRKRKMNRIR